MSAKDIESRFRTLTTERSVFLSSWQEVADYIMPRKSMILAEREPGSRGNVVLYDSTAIHANNLLASSLQGAFSTGWFDVDFVDEELNETESAREWLDECVRRMYIAYGRSNFQSESHETFLDLTALGTGCMLCEERPLKTRGFNGLRFRTFAIDEYVIDEDGEGMVNTIIRKFKYTARNAVKAFGKKAGKKALDKIMTKPDEEIEYFHATMPSEDYDGYTPKLPYVSAISTVGDNEMVKIYGQHEFPYITPRWMKYSKEKYGRGPGFDALPDVKTLNKIKQHGLKALSKDLDPPLLGPIGVGKLTLTPGSLNVLRADLIDKIKPLLSGARYNVVEMKIDELRQSIKEIFYTDQLQIQKKAQMTATESNITFELMQRLLGPVFGRLGTEMYEPTTRRVFGLMLRANAFPPAPEAVRKAAIEVKYAGPIIKSQRQAEVQAINAWLESITAMASVKPDILDVVDFDTVAKGLGRTLGVGEKYIVDSDIVENKRRERQEAEQAQRQQETMLEGAKVLPQVAQVMNQMRTTGGVGL